MAVEKSIHLYVLHFWKLYIIIKYSHQQPRVSCYPASELTLWVLEPDFEGFCKQFGSRRDAAERGVSSGSKLFAILIVFFGKKSKKMLILEI